VLAPNAPPGISITAPSSGAAFTAPANIPITVSTTDSDGTVTLVEHFANGGDVLIPTVVRGLSDAAGQFIPLNRQTVKRRLDIDARNIGIMREAMRQAVADGTALPATVANLQVAGKTGTAEFGEQIAPGRFRESGWYTGYAPFDNPEIAVVVFTKEGGGEFYGAAQGYRIIVL
jgi:cell division protein FtsI/penicillin-binding protein 2